MMLRSTALATVAFLLPSLALAQQPVTVPARPAPKATLTLADAVAQARANSPAYRQFLNDAGPAHSAVKNAYMKPQIITASLFLIAQSFRSARA